MSFPCTVLAPVVQRIDGDIQRDKYYQNLLSYPVDRAIHPATEALTE